MTTPPPRERILKVARFLFLARGYERVGINEIIAQAEVAKASFYLHFPSKEELCLEWLKLEAETTRLKSEELLASAKSWKSKVAQKFQDLATYAETNHFRGCPFSITSAVVDPPSKVKLLIEDYKNTTRAFWHEIASQHPSGPTPAAARKLGDTLFLLYSGAVTESQNVQNLWPIQSALKIATTLR